MDKGVGSHTKGSLQVGFEAPSEQVFDHAKKLWRLTPQVKYTKYNSEYGIESQATVAQWIRGWVPIPRVAYRSGFQAPSEQVFDNAKKLWRLTPQVLPLGFELTKTCPGFQTQVQSFPKMFQIYKI